MEAVKMTFLSVQGPTLINNGFHIVPIAPGTKYPKLKAWSDITATVADVQKWERTHDGVGILAKHTPGVDLDIRDTDTSNDMVTFVENLLGSTVQRVGEAPKTLLVYRTDEPFTKVQSSTYVDPFGVEHKVEILGDGQQFVAFATHPDTNQPYQWTSEKNLSEVNAWDLPTITQEQAVQIVEHFQSIVPDYWSIKPGTSASTPSLTVVDDFTVLENIKPPVDVATIKIKQALKYISADQYETWVRVGMALFHQYDGQPDGFEVWETWSKTSTKFDSKGIGFKWDSFKTDLRKNPVTAATILKMASEAKKKGVLTVADDDVHAFKLIHGKDILSKLKPVPWLVRGVIEQDSTGLMFGDPANFKSFITIDLACHVAAGKTWHGHDVTGGPVIYVAGEGHNGFARRLAAWQAGNEGFLIEDMPIYFSQKATGFYDQDEAVKVTAEIDRIVETEGHAPSMIVIDTLARNFGAGDENSTSDMNMFVNHVDAFLRSKYGCVVLIVHHTGKADKNHARGSSALKGAVDFEYRMDRPDDSEDELTCEMVNTKMKDAPEPAPIWFQGEEKVVGDFDEDVTSLVFKKTDPPGNVSPTEKLKGRQLALFNFTKQQTEFDGFIERKELAKVTVDSGICTDRKQFNTAIGELIKKRLLEEKDKEISVIEGFL